MKMFTNFVSSNTQAWRDRLKNLKAVAEHVREYSQNVPGLAPVLKREYEQEKERSIGAIQNGILGEYQAAMKKYMDSAQWRDTQKTREIKQWDPGKLASERQYIRMQIQDILNHDPNLSAGEKSNEGRLRALWDECLNTGDKHKTRAALEEFQGIPTGDPSGRDKFIINRLSKEAEKELAVLRVTPEIKAAEAEMSQALTDLLARNQELNQVSMDLGEGDLNGGFASGPMARAYKQVRVVGGDLYILPPDDPEVTGVDWSSFREEGDKGNE